MKKVIVAAIFSCLCFSSCNSLFKKKSGGKVEGLDKGGQIVARKSSQGWAPIRPIDMVPVPSGSFVMGQTDYEFTQQGNAPIRTVTVSGFFIDETEVTNQKYLVFVNYVRDSIVRWNLAEKARELGVETSDGSKSTGSINDYAFLDPSLDNPKGSTAYYDYIMENADGRDGGTDEQLKLNWDAPLFYDVNEYPDIDYTEILEDMYYPPEERFNNERHIDVRKLNYKYSQVDTYGAARSRGKGSRSSFITQHELNIYPDTTVWANDFDYAYNEPMHENYFRHDAFIDYPVVGVTWDQANAYCDFKTRQQNEALKKAGKKGLSAVLKYRLPNEGEWEYAARGRLQDAPYPWGGPHLTDERGCYLANFKPKRGDYIESQDEDSFGYLYSSPVKTYPPNEYGLYDMAGNVAEWTSTSYNNASYNTTSTLNPSLGRYSTSLKVVRGGSWKDIGYLLMVSARDFEEKDSARSFIGFRTVQTIPEGAKVRFRKVK